MSCCKDKGNPAVVGAMKMRARMYYHIFSELREELGEERATAIMKRAIRKGGADSAQFFSQYAPADLPGLKDAFLSWVPDNAAMFSPEVVTCNDQELVIQFHACPLKEAYEEMGWMMRKRRKSWPSRRRWTAAFSARPVLISPPPPGSRARPAAAALHIRPGKG